MIHLLSIFKNRVKMPIKQKQNLLREVNSVVVVKKKKKDSLSTSIFITNPKIE
jgi:hypothetical protein|tara:strand:+ start:7641 stop:7799 length:159 start_codon:yes stop_codon:yes gene_type:complete